MSEELNEPNSQSPELGQDIIPEEQGLSDTISEEYVGSDIKSPEEQQEFEPKLPTDDESLSLIKKPALDKRVLKLILLGFSGLVSTGLVIGFQPHNAKAKAEQTEKKGFQSQTPQDLGVNDSDYLSSDARRAQEYPASSSGVLGARTNVSQQSSPPRSEQQNGSQPAYKTYDLQPRGGTFSASPSNSNSQNSTQSPFQEKAISPEELAAKSGLFFPFQALSEDDNAKSQGPNQSTGAPQVALVDPYQQQNMIKEKEDFFARAQANDYSGYLQNKYTNPMDLTHELKTGAIIPIILLTSINSDNPGDVIAQVLENVYDSYSGNNILIPKGSRVWGQYSSAISFGQNRVMLAWDRLILPDGVTINLRGMEGADLQGQSGMADKTDYHLDKILEAISLATVFDIGKLSAESALSSTQFLSALSSAITAQGSASQSVSQATTSIVEIYASKIMNQAPTITIREGFQANIIVSKDIILPSFSDISGTYTFQ